MSKHVNPDALSEDDIQYIQDRPNLRREFILQGLGDPLDENYPGRLSNQDGSEKPEDSEPTGNETIDNEGSTNVQSDLPEDQQWTEQNKKDELEAVIEARNVSREDESWHIKPDGSNKADLQEALRADDTRIAEFNASE